jgi:hypothetical protein
LSTKLHEFLSGITLAQFVERPGIPELSLQRDKKIGRFILAKKQAAAINQGVFTVSKNLNTNERAGTGLVDKISVR